LNIDYIFIDNILQKNNEYNLSMLKIYQDAIESINQNKFDVLIEGLYKKCLDIVNDREKVASGFIGGIKEIKHYEPK
ncbi:MAG: hypothetical protein K2N40_00945, partial [Ureaplasma sp.]|nr:hypothetical protein [Ureaplasma sp.]